MKQNLFFISICTFLMVSCSDKHDDSVYEYHAHIESPANNATKKINDTLQITVDFESHTGQTVHHINIQIKNKSNSTVLFNEPLSAHVHETDGMYTFQQNLILSVANGFTANSSYTLTAKVWGEQDGEEEEVETIEFKIE